MASRISGNKAFIATAEALDKEMQQRIENHKRQRGKEWTTYEEPLKIVDIINRTKGKYNAIVIDCLTLWLSNLLIKMQKNEYQTQLVENEIVKFLDMLNSYKYSAFSNTGLESSMFIVSNEVGMGIVPENEISRKFRDIAGILNQKVADCSDEVYITITGIPVKIKG